MHHAARRYLILFELNFDVNRNKRRHTQHDAKHTIARTAPHPAPRARRPPGPRPAQVGRICHMRRWNSPREKRERKYVWEVEVVHHAARRFSLSGTAPPL